MLYTPVHGVVFVERCLCRNIWHSVWNVSTYEQHGRATRLSLAVVYHIPCHRLLVLHGHVVVSTVTSADVLATTFPTPSALRPFMFHAQSSASSLPHITQYSLLRNHRLSIIIGYMIPTSSKSKVIRTMSASVRALRLFTQFSVPNLPYHPPAKILHVLLLKRELFQTARQRLEELAGEYTAIVAVLLLRRVLRSLHTSAWKPVFRSDA